MASPSSLSASSRSAKDPQVTLIEFTERRFEKVAEALKALSPRVKKLLKQFGLNESVTPLVTSNGPPASKPASGDAVLATVSLQKVDVVINVDPVESVAPYWLKALAVSLSKRYRVLASTHCHSSVVSSKLSERLRDFLTLGEESLARSQAQVILTLVWKRCGSRPNMVVAAGRTPVRGETNIARFLCRLMMPPSSKEDVLLYGEEGCGSAEAVARLDSQLDRIESFYQSKGRSSKVSPAELFPSREELWLCGRNFTVADILLWSYLKAKGDKDESACLKKWRAACSSVSCIAEAEKM